MTWKSWMDNCERRCDEMEIISSSMRIIGPVLFSLFFGLFSFIVYTFFVQILPYWVTPFTSWYYIHTIISIFLMINIIFNYVSVIRTDPGTTPSTLSLYDYESAPYEQPKVCKKCQRIKPPRAHHCTICKKCVLKMDHHCPWVMNCVGHQNHKFFVLFLLWLWIACMYIAALSAPLMFTIFSGTEPDVPLLLTFVLTGCFSIVLIGFVGFNLYLVATGQTQLEFYDNSLKKDRAKKKGMNWVNQYDLGAKKNLQMFFNLGSNKWYTFSYLLPSYKPALGDGINWPTVLDN